MALTDAGANVALDAITGTITLAIHTGAPGSTGSANEVSGGSYARQTITLAAASGRSRAMTGSLPVFNIPSGTTTSHYSVFAGATCVDTGALPASQVYAADGTLTVTSLTISIS